MMPLAIFGMGVVVFASTALYAIWTHQPGGATITLIGALFFAFIMGMDAGGRP